jgi:hypothetical protein
MKTPLPKLAATTTMIALAFLTALYAAPLCQAQNYITTSYQLLDKPGGNTAYTLNIVIPQNLLQYYEQQSDRIPSASSFPQFVTPYSVKPIADTLRTIYQNDEDFANAVLMIVHQMDYVETTPGKYPVETLADNTGDCDIFSVLAASIIKAGGLNVVLLYYEDQSHMNIGIHLNNQPQNARESIYSVENDNTTYYIAECTGGNLTYGWRVGECPDNLQQAQTQVITLENDEEIAPGQVSASFTTLEPSDIAVEISPPIALEDSSITLHGQLTPTIPNQNVTIYLGISGYPWQVLTTIPTEPDGTFAYTWKTTFAGLYAIRASWNGDETYASAVSITQTGTVIPMLLALLIGLAVLATILGVIAVLFTRHSHHDKIEPQAPQPPTFV